MNDHNTMLNSQIENNIPDTNSHFSQYLSFRFYKENLEHLTDITKDSINNFLKTVTEIEDDFMNMLQTQRRNNEWQNLGFEGEMEENY
jgi:hypothetical protein